MIYKGHRIEKSPQKTISGKELWRLELADPKTFQLWNVDACPLFVSLKAAQQMVNWLYEMRRILYSPVLKEVPSNGEDNRTAS